MKSRINTFIQRVQANSFLKNVGTLALSVVISQAITFAFTPVISRVFTNEILGEFSAITSAANIINAVVTLGLLSAIMIPKEDRDAVSICIIVMLATGVLGAIIVVAAISLQDVFLMFKTSANYSLSCLYLYAYIIASNLYTVCFTYANRIDLYRNLFIAPMIGAISNALITTILGLCGFGLLGYAMGSLISTILSSGYLLLVLRVHVQCVIRPDTRRILREYRRFPCQVLPIGLVSTLSRQLPIQIMNQFYSVGALGSYSMAIRILQMPTNFLAGPVNRVYYKEASRRYNDGQSIGEFSFSILKGNMRLAFVPIAIITMFGEYIFSFVLGAEWMEAGSFAAILACYEFVAFCNACLSGKYIIIKKQKTILLLNIGGVFITGCIFLICGSINTSVETTLLIYAIIESLYSLLDLTLFMHYSKVNMRKVCTFYLRYLILPIALMIVGRFIVKALL